MAALFLPAEGEAFRSPRLLWTSSVLGVAVRYRPLVPVFFDIMESSDEVVCIILPDWFHSLPSEVEVRVKEHGLSSIIDSSVHSV